MPMLTCEKYRQMAKGSLDDRLAVASENVPNECASEISLALSKDESPQVREALASNKNMGFASVCRVLGRLTKDKDDSVRKAAERNPLFTGLCDGQHKMDYVITPWYDFDVMRADARCRRGCNYQRLVGELEAQDVDVVSVKDWKETDASSLKELGFDFIPEKISWYLNARFYGSFDKYLDCIKKGAYIKRYINRLAKDNISFVIQNVSDDAKLYDQWYAIYKDTMEHKKRGRLIVKEQPSHLKALYAVKDNDKVLGGILFNDRPGMVSGAYGAFLRSPSGLSTTAMAKLVEHAIIVDSDANLGMDTNLYGFHLNTGLYSFKTSLGYKPRPYKGADREYFKVLNDKKFEDPYMYLSYPSYADNPDANSELQNNIFVRNADKLMLEPFDAPDGITVHHNGKKHRYQVVEDTDYFQGDAGA